MKSKFKMIAPYFVLAVAACAIYLLLDTIFKGHNKIESNSSKLISNNEYSDKLFKLNGPEIDAEGKVLKSKVFYDEYIRYRDTICQSNISKENKKLQLINFNIDHKKYAYEYLDDLENFNKSIYDIGEFVVNYNYKAKDKIRLLEEKLDDYKEEVNSSNFDDYDDCSSEKVMHYVKYDQTYSYSRLAFDNIMIIANNHGDTSKISDYDLKILNLEKK